MRIEELQQLFNLSNGKVMCNVEMDHSHNDRYYTKAEIDSMPGGGNPDWTNVQNKPATFPPSAHGHDYAPLVHTHSYEPANANIQSHVTGAHAPANAQKNSDILKAEIEAVLTGVISSHSHAGGSGDTIISITNPVTNNNAVANTLQDVTGLLFPVVSGQVYRFETFIPYTAAATATGSRWVLSGPAGTYSYTSEWTLTATAKTVHCLGAINLPAACNATSLTTGNLCTIWGVIAPSASGNVQVRFASEVPNSAIVALAGAHIKYRQL